MLLQFLAGLLLEAAEDRMRVRGWIGVSLMLWCAGCGSSTQASSRPQAPQGSRGREEVREQCNPSGHRVVSTDVNNDNVADVLQVYDGSREICREVDLNFDGRKDVFAYFGPDGRPVRREDDFDWDGRIDQITYYRGSEIDREELDLNFDNRIDTWRYFRAGAVVRTERDTNNDRHVDYWEEYEGDRVARIRYDTNGDGRPDRVDDHPDLGEEGGPPGASPPGKRPRPPAKRSPGGGATATPTAPGSEAGGGE